MLMNLLPAAEAIDDRVSGIFRAPIPFRRMTNRRWPRVLGAWIERGRQRRALAGLDDRLLDDVGIARCEAAREIAKPFWR